MQESIPQTGITSAGITVAGITLGLHPALLLAGFCGAMWSLSFCPPMPALRRAWIAGISTFVAAYGTPAVVASLRSVPWWPESLTGEIAQYPCSLLIGFLAHQVIGPALLKIASKKADEADQ